MRTLALALAAAVLGTGCIIDGDDDDRGCLPNDTITVEWSTFTTGDGRRLGCGAAGVSWVDIYMDVGQGSTLVDSWSCTDGGAIITDVAPGTYPITVEGVEASGRIAFRDELGVSTASCGGRLVRAEPAEGFVELLYAVPGDVCAANPSYLWFSVFDEVAGATTAAIDDASALADKRAYTCGPEALVFPLPAGAHTLDWMQEMVEGPVGVFEVFSAQCNRTPFDVPRGSYLGVPVVMVDAVASCL